MMLKAKLIKISLILVLVGLSMWGCTRASFSGTHLVLRADLSNIPADQQQSLLEDTKEIIENRAIAYGVDEPIIQIQGDDRISVQLPGVIMAENVDEAVQLIGTAAEVDFRKLAEEAADGKTELAAYVAEGDTTITVRAAYNFTGGSSIRIGSNYNNDYVIESIDDAANTITMKTGATTLYVASTAVTQWIPATGVIDGVSVQLAGEHFGSDATAKYQGGITAEPVPVVSFSFKGDGPALFGQITTELINKPLGIFLDNVLISSPRVMETLSDGEAVITGLHITEAKLLAIQLNHGALPVKLELISQEVILPE